MTDQPPVTPPGESTGEPATPRRRYPHLYYRRERRISTAPVYYDEDDYALYDYGAVSARDLPDPADMDRGDEPADGPSPAPNPLWKWFLIAIMILIVVSMIAADLQGVIAPPDILPTPTRPLNSL